MPATLRRKYAVTLQPRICLLELWFTGLFRQRGVNCCRQIILPILDISIRSKDIRDRSLKLSEVDPNFARLWPQIGGGPLKLQNIYGLQNWRDFPSRGNVWRRSADGALISRGEKRKKRHICSKTYNRREPPFRAAELCHNYAVSSTTVFHSEEQCLRSFR